MFQSCFTSLKSLRNKSLLFLIIQLFYLPFVFSNPYREDNSENIPIAKASWTCELDYECLNNLKTNLDKESKYSIYKVCQGEYDTVKNCCASLNNCPSRYKVDRDFGILKSNLLNSEEPEACSASSMSNLKTNIQAIQKDTCELGAKLCKAGCEKKLNEFKRRLKRCFSISSSIDEALKEAKTAKVETTCYKRLKEAAEIYKRQSRDKKSELREDLSVQDIVNCEEVKNKGNPAIATKKAMEICSQANQELLQRQEAERQKKEEEERQQAEQKQKEEKERQAREEAKRAKEEERQRKAKEEKQRREQSALELKAISQANKGQTDNNAEKPKAQASATEQPAESEKPQASDVKTINPLETEDKKEEGKEKANKEKAEKDKESKEEKKKEDESKKADKKDEKQDKKQDEKDKTKDDKKKEKPKTKDTKPAKNSQKSSVGSKASAVAVTGTVIGTGSQPANTQTSPVLNSQKKEPKKTAVKTKQTKNLKQAKKSNDVIASFDKTSADNTKLSQTTSSTQTQPAENSSISSLAGNTEDTSQCPPMPEISSQVVYQSVEAPQIEPLNSETDPYNNYDLVANKPAVVLLSLQPPQNIKDIEKHSITLKHLKLKNDITVFPKECSKVFNAIELFPQRYFKFVDEKEFEEEIKLSFKKSNCTLRRSDYKRNQRDIQKQLNKIKTPLKVAKEDIEDNLYVFVKLPTTTRFKNIGIPEKKYISVSLTNDKNKLCSKRSDFFIFLRNTRKLYLDFMTVEYDLKTKRDRKMNLKCKPYEISDLSVLQSFSDSREIQEYIPKMFPMSEGTLFSQVKTNINIKATCYNKFHDRRNTSLGLLLDALTAENWAFNRIPTVPTEKDRPYKTKEGFKLLNRKTVVIVSEEYMKYHNKSGVAGFFITPLIRGKDMTGSWNVIFVNSDVKDRGTIAHELAHALGQKQEYYLLEYKNKQNEFVTYSNDQQDWCKKFSNEKPILCHTYKVFGGLMASFKLNT